MATTAFGNGRGGVTLEGTAELRSALIMLGERAIQSLAGALYREGQYVMTESKEQVPVDTGTLRSTGMVSEPIIRGSEVTVVLSYGGPAEAYALIVHEDLEAKHTTGKAKYLEDPMLEAARGLDARIAADLRKDLGL